MARQTEIATAPAAVISVASVTPIVAPAPSIKPQTAGLAPEPIVREWVADNSDGFATESGVPTGEPTTDGETPVAAAAPETETPEGEAAETPAETPVDAAKAARVARRETLSVLKLESQKRELETRLAAENTERKRLEADASVPLAKRLKGLSQEEKDLILETLITGGDAPEPSAAVTPPKEDAPEFAALRKQVADMEAKLAKRESENQQVAIQQAVTAVAEMTADQDLPLLHAYGKLAVPLEGANGMTGYQLVLGTANALWEQSGKRGTMSDHLPEAANKVEAYLDEGYAIAIAAGVKKRGGPTNTVPAPKAASPAAALGKRTAARKPEVDGELSMNRQERDAQIKREMGW